MHLVIILALICLTLAKFNSTMGPPTSSSTNMTLNSTVWPSTKVGSHQTSSKVPTTTTPNSIVEGSHPGILSSNLSHISDQELQVIKDMCHNDTCINQTSESIQRRAVVMQIRLDALKRNIAYRLNPSLAHKTVEDSMTSVFKAKQIYMRKFGIPHDLVVSADDGLFFGHVLLTDLQASQIISMIPDPMLAPLWPMPIAYHISQNISNATATLIDDIIKQLENQTCLRFVKKMKVYEYELSNVLTFEDMPIEANNMWCSLATLGHVSPSLIYLNSNCTSTIAGEIMHSMLFSLGIVGHEINRLDRDQYLSVHWDKIRPEFYDVYAINDWKSVFGLHFDVNSVSNLGTTFGAKNKDEVTITMKNSSSTIGQRTKFSCGDLEILKKMYCCPGCMDFQHSCGYLAADGFCNKNTNWFWMKLNCQKSCNYCCRNSCATRPDCIEACSQ